MDNEATLRRLYDSISSGDVDAFADVLSSGDKVVARSQVTGTHSGTFGGIPATGRSIDAQAIDILRFEDDGLVHEHWGVMDVMTLMQQLGVVPAGSPA